MLFFGPIARFFFMLSLLIGAQFASSPLTFSAVMSDPIREPCTNTFEAIQRPQKINPLICERPFKYKDQLYPTDSPQAQDAANLRAFVSSVESSKKLLDDYQSNRKKSTISAYTGTVGLALFLLSGPISKLAKGSSSALKSAMTLGGLSLAAGGFIYSFALLKGNETLIQQSVQEYNQAKPNDPIQLQFSAGWLF